jgi:hypothetical protein
LFLAISLGIPLILSAATIPVVDLGPGSGVITFGVSPATITLASGDIMGSGTDNMIPLPWSITTSPSSVFDLVGGDVQESVSGETMTFNVHDNVGDSITGGIVTFGSGTPDFFTYTATPGGGDTFNGTVQITSASEGLLLGMLGLTPAKLDGTDLSLTIQVDCGTQDPCIATADPMGTITDLKIGPSTGTSGVVPEPSFVFLLGGALASLPLLRRRWLKRAS